jgi:hypothetical protein
MKCTPKELVPSPRIDNICQMKTAPWTGVRVEFTDSFSDFLVHFASCATTQEFSTNYYGISNQFRRINNTVWIPFPQASNPMDKFELLRLERRIGIKSLQLTCDRLLKVPFSDRPPRREEIPMYYLLSLLALIWTFI